MHINVQQKMMQLQVHLTLPEGQCFGRMTTESLRLNGYVACRYDKKWQIGVVKEVDRVEQDLKINFLHQSGPARSFHWPRKPDVCWVAITDVI